MQIPVAAWWSFAAAALNRVQQVAASAEVEPLGPKQDLLDMVGPIAASDEVHWVIVLAKRMSLVVASEVPGGTTGSGLVLLVCSSE